MAAGIGRGAWQPARLAAIDSLLALNDPRLDGAQALAVRDAGLESSDLLNKIEEQLCKRKVGADLALTEDSLDQREAVQGPDDTPLVTNEGARTF